MTICLTLKFGNKTVGKAVDISGKTFGSLVAVQPTDKVAYQNIVWLCYCDPRLGGCGKYKEVIGNRIRSGRVVSCGCLQSKRSSKRQLEKRFWIRTEIKDIDNPDSCWEWIGTRNKLNYGLVGIDRKIKRATAVSWFLTNGYFPSGLEVCHKCDNPPCVRPDHLFLGTHTDNVRDAVLKKRSRSHTNTNMKITLEMAEEIRKRAENGETIESLADFFNVTPSYIGLIIRHKRRFGKV